MTTVPMKEIDVSIATKRFQQILLVGAIVVSVSVEHSLGFLTSMCVYVTSAGIVTIPWWFCGNRWAKVAFSIILLSCFGLFINVWNSQAVFPILMIGMLALELVVHSPELPTFLGGKQPRAQDK
jgi:hypothetical protein